MIIRGNTVGVTTPAANWFQEDPTKADYIRGRDVLAFGMAQVQQHFDSRENPHGVTARQAGAAAQEHTHTADQVGALTEAQVRSIIGEELGVIEHGAY